MDIQVIGQMKKKKNREYAQHGSDLCMVPFSSYSCHSMVMQLIGL